MQNVFCFVLIQMFPAVSSPLLSKVESFAFASTLRMQLIILVVAIYLFFSLNVIYSLMLLHVLENGGTEL